MRAPSDKQTSIILKIHINTKTRKNRTLAILMKGKMEMQKNKDLLIIKS